ncbi:hypothetical protein [Cytobacillus purgationiresistens]|uniref:Radical SAM protein n=1 Tax=Cytobacillus purgationiresistens TaxID=863449 RepID=A0ABU0ALE4_9BACI|nr:hypothetical protein [Cytobacillus purgationiresistens]MDQ0272093.1 hypothetical protein [Cytobacillus purgationiresistens]
MKEFFTLNERLGILVPSFEYEWEMYDKETQQGILLYWEKIKGHIPDRMAELEKIINRKQDALSNESDFNHSCRLNSEIAELASQINDLWLWYRTNQNLSDKRHF